MSKIEDLGATARQSMPWWRGFELTFGTTAKQHMLSGLYRECGNKNAAFHLFLRNRIMIGSNHAPQAKRVCHRQM